MTVVHIWGPKEEGIFRISGQSSHVAALKRQFDSGADIDLTEFHPRDLDPHAVAGLFKSYLRECKLLAWFVVWNTILTLSCSVPSPLLTHALAPKFEKAVGKKEEAVKRSSMAGNVGDEEFDGLLRQLPQAHWFLLAEISMFLFFLFYGFCTDIQADCFARSTSPRSHPQARCYQSNDS